MWFGAHENLANHAKRAEQLKDHKRPGMSGAPEPKTQEVGSKDLAHTPPHQHWPRLSQHLSFADL